MPSRDNTSIRTLNSIRRLCLCAMLLGATMLLSYLEGILPLMLWLPLPGFKLGFPNVLITAIFVVLSPRDAACISLCRILLMGLLFGNAVSLLFSLCGGLLAYAGLWLLARLGQRYFSMIGISVGCAALHNVGQMLAAGALFGMEVVRSYLPWLLLSSLIFGSVTGILLHLLVPRLGRIFHTFVRGGNT